MVIITIDRKTGKEKSIEVYEHKDDINLNDAIKAFAACIQSSNKRARQSRSVDKKSV